MASIEVKGLDKVFAKLGAVSSIAILEKPMQRAVARIEYDMKEYPPAPSGSRYIRGYGWRGGPMTSEKLGQRWTTRVTTTSNGVIGKVGNNASYGPWVQSARFQTRIHKRTGWTTDQQAIDKNLPAIQADFQREIDRALAE
jgi:hypothetical protein